MAAKIHTAKLNDEARSKVLELIEMEKQMGDHQLGAAMEVLLEIHDRNHDIQTDQYNQVIG